jgi:hypothetical protein
VLCTDEKVWQFIGLSLGGLGFARSLRLVIDSSGLGVETMKV